MAFDPSQPLSEQDYAEGKTWQDFFMENAATSALQVEAMKAEAAAAGYEMPETYQDEYNSILESMPDYAAQAGFTDDQGNGDLLAYVQDSYGAGATVESFQQYLYDSYYVTAYSDHLYQEVTVDDSELDSWYDENQEMYATYGILKSDLPNVNVRHILIAPEAAAEEIVNLIENRLPRAYHVSPFDIQILTPMQRGVIGAAALNTRLQQLLNPQEQVLHRGGIAFGERDKVMQIRNNYDKDVYNGDIGTVTKVDLDERLLYAEFDGRIVSYEVSELNELVLAYATTVHKSQGSEYPIVIMPIMMSHFVMLQRNLIYTGITRAKRIMILVGQKKALAYCIHNLTVDQRNSRLRQRLQETNTAP